MKTTEMLRMMYNIGSIMAMFGAGILVINILIAMFLEIMFSKQYAKYENFEKFSKKVSYGLIYLGGLIMLGVTFKIVGIILTK